MPKIIYLSYQPHFLSSNAATNRIEAVTKGLIENNVKVELWGMIAGRINKEESELYNFRYLPFFKLGNSFAIKSFLLIIAFFNLMLRVVKLKKGDVLVTYHHMLIPFDIIILFSAKLKGVKTMIEFTEPLDFFFKYKWLFILYEKLVLGYYDAYIAISNNLANTLSKYNKPIITLNMIVDYNRFNISKINSKFQDAVYFGYCGSLNQHKDGVLDLILAYMQYIKTTTDPYKLILVGKGDAAFVNNIRFIIKENKLLDNIIIINELSKMEIIPFLINARCLILARPDSEQAKFGFPTKLGEYLISGNPVIVTKVGNIELFLENEKNAILINSNNVPELTDALIRVFRFPVKYKIIALAGKETALNYFNYKIESNKLINFIQNNIDASN